MADDSKMGGTPDVGSEGGVANYERARAAFDEFADATGLGDEDGEGSEQIIDPLLDDNGDAGDADDADSAQDDEGADGDDEDDAGDDDPEGDLDQPEDEDTPEPNADIVAGLLRSGLTQEEAEALAASNPDLAAGIAGRHPEASEDQKAEQAREAAEFDRAERVGKAKKIIQDKIGLFEGDEADALIEAIEALAGPADPDAVGRLVRSQIEEQSKPIADFASGLSIIRENLAELTFRASVAELQETGRYPELADKKGVLAVRTQVEKMIKAGTNKGMSPQEAIETAAAVVLGSKRAAQIAKAQSKVTQAKRTSNANVRPTTRPKSGKMSAARKAFEQEMDRQTSR